MDDHFAGQCSECQAKLQQLLPQRATCCVDLGKAPRSGSKARAEFERRQVRSANRVLSSCAEASSRRHGLLPPTCPLNSLNSRPSQRFVS